MSRWVKNGIINDMSKQSHSKHEKHERAKNIRHDNASDELIVPDFPQRHKALMIVILIVFTIMSTLVFAFLYIFG